MRGTPSFEVKKGKNVQKWTLGTIGLRELISKFYHSLKKISPPADFQFEKLPEKCRERNVVITTTNKCYFDNKLSRHDGYQGEKIFSVLNQNFRFYRITQT